MKKIVYLAVTLLSFLSMSACVMNPVVSAGCSDPASYELVFTSSWSAETHPQDFPNNPHFSGLIGAVHNAELVLWQAGDLASPGIQVMAETGSKSPLDSEIDAAISTGTASSMLSGGGIALSPGDVSLDLEVTEAYSKVSIVSMIAPSPDWFVGVNGVELCENGEWLAEKNIELFPYDAGTDSGPSYASANSPTLPAESITRLEEAPLLVAGSVPSLGSFSLKKK